MQIACIDSTSSARLRLQGKLEKYFEDCRSSTGHLPLHTLYPISEQELFLSNEPEVVVLGANQSIEESYSLASKIGKRFPDTTILIFLKDSNLTLSNLRRFESKAHTVFGENEPAIRILHQLEHVNKNSGKNREESLSIYVDGAKGGVGTTSIVTGLAHASTALGFQTLICDLSPYSSLSHYLQLGRSSSSEMTSVLTDGLSPTEQIIDGSVDRSANGLELLLPPSNQKDIRDLWLRDPLLFETSLQIFDLAKKQYDIIIIDGSRAEGILPYSLQSTADHSILVSQNTPSSAHLLDKTLSELKNVPGFSSCQVLINQSSNGTLRVKDIEKILAAENRHQDVIFHQAAIPFDEHAGSWMGSGNSFYTESKKKTQKILIKSLEAIIDSTASVEEIEAGQKQNLFSSIKAILLNRGDFRESNNDTKLLDGPKEGIKEDILEPQLSEDLPQETPPNKKTIRVNKPNDENRPLRNHAPKKAGKCNKKPSNTEKSTTNIEEATELYDPPELVNN